MCQKWDILTFWAFFQDFCEVGNLSQLILFGEALNFNKLIFTAENTVSWQILKPATVISGFQGRVEEGFGTWQGALDLGWGCILRMGTPWLFQLSPETWSWKGCQCPLLSPPWATPVPALEQSSSMTPLAAPHRNHKHWHHWHPCCWTHCSVKPW